MEAIAQSLSDFGHLIAIIAISGLTAMAITIIFAVTNDTEIRANETFVFTGSDSQYTCQISDDLKLECLGGEND